MYKSSIRGRSGQVFIDDILANKGPLLDQTPVAPDVIAAWEGILPPIVLDFWRNHGIGTLQGGLMRLCLPGDFDGLLSQIFHADKDFSHKDCHVIGHSPFGKLIVWSARHWLVEVDLTLSRIVCNGLVNPEKKRDENSTALVYLLGHPPDGLDIENEAGKRIYVSALKKLGPLEAGQVYGFAPALAVGGEPAVKNLSVMPALEHFLFLAQLQQFGLYDFLGKPPGLVRMVG